MHIMGKSKRMRLLRATRTEIDCDEIDYFGRAALGYICGIGVIMLFVSLLGLAFFEEDFASTASLLIMLIAAIFAVIPTLIAFLGRYTGEKKDQIRVEKLRMRMIMSMLSILASIICLLLLISLSLTTTECHCHLAMLLIAAAFLAFIMGFSVALIRLLRRSTKSTAYVRGWDYPWH